MCWIRVKLKKSSPRRNTNGLILQMRKLKPKMLGTFPKVKCYREWC